MELPPNGAGIAFPILPAAADVDAKGKEDPTGLHPLRLSKRKWEMGGRSAGLGFEIEVGVRVGAGAGVGGKGWLGG